MSSSSLSHSVYCVFDKIECKIQPNVYADLWTATYSKASLSWTPQYSEKFLFYFILITLSCHNGGPFTSVPALPFPLQFHSPTSTMSILPAV